MVSIQAALARTPTCSDKSVGSIKNPLRTKDLGTATVKTPFSYPAEIPFTSIVSGSLNFLRKLLAGSVDSSAASVLMIRYLESSISTLISSFFTPGMSAE